MKNIKKLLEMNHKMFGNQGAFFDAEDDLFVEIVAPTKLQKRTNSSISLMTPIKGYKLPITPSKRNSRDFLG